MFGKGKNNFLFLPGKLFQRNQRGLTASDCLGSGGHRSKCRRRRGIRETADAINYIRDNT
jgi:hypothetical protein